MEDEVVVVCGSTSFFGDDVKATCGECGAEVYHRPHAPAGARVCCRCVLKRMGPGEQFAVSVTPESAREAVEYIRAERAQAAEKGGAS